MKFLGTHCPERVQGTTCECLFNRDSFKVRSRVFLVSIVVSIPACHAGDRGSIPRRGDYNTTFFRKEIFLLFGFVLLSWILPCWLISVFTEQATPFWWKPTAAISLERSQIQRGGSKCAIWLEIFRDLAIWIFICQLRWRRCCLYRNRP